LYKQKGMMPRIHRHQVTSSLSNKSTVHLFSSRYEVLSQLVNADKLMQS
jgi:hypothetical protein